jgi:sec-independent protein translocase protein TatC
MLTTLVRLGMQLVARADDDEIEEKDFHSLLDHIDVLGFLDDLRRRLLVCVLSLFFAFVATFFVSDWLYRFLMLPLRAALPAGGALVATRITEIFVLHLQMSLVVAVILVIPVWLYEFWKLAAKVRPIPTSTVLPVLLLGSSLFVTGAAFGHYVLFPYAARFLTHFGSSSVRPLLSVGAAFSFYAAFVLGLGAAFQIPTVVYVLSVLNLVTPRLLLRVWKYVVLAVFVFAAILTPTPDVVTQSLLAFPMLGLYLISIVLCWLVRRGARER